MTKIAAIRTGKGKRLNIIINSKTLNPEFEVAGREALHVKQELSKSEGVKLVMTDRFQRCLKTALRYLSYRPRSESELKDRLGQRGFDSDTQEAVIVRLKEKGLLNDLAFAQFWVDNRESFSPRSQQLTRLELRRKGIATEIIEEAVRVINDADNAYRLAINKTRNSSLSDYESFRRRLGGYLTRRGFNYDVISHTVERIRQEQVR